MKREKLAATVYCPSNTTQATMLPPTVQIVLEYLGVVLETSISIGKLIPSTVYTRHTWTHFTQRLDRFRWADWIHWIFIFAILFSP